MRAPFSSTRRAGDFLFVSGEAGIDPSTGQKVAGGIASETRQTFENIRATLRGAGVELDQVVSVTCYVTDIGDRGVMDEEYLRWFSEPLPVRTTVEVSALALELCLEVSVIAYDDRGISGTAAAVHA